MAIQVPVMDVNGKELETIELPSDIFEAPINVGLMHQAYVRQMANARLGTHDTKNRGEVERTKRKMYRQKGTGRARHGNRKAPIFVGGGVAHGPHPRKYTLDMPRKMRQAALRSALSAKAAEGAVVVVNELVMDAPKTRIMADALYRLCGEDSALVLLAEPNTNVELSIRNLTQAKYLRANYLNIRDLLKYDRLVIPVAALDVLVAWLSKESEVPA